MRRFITTLATAALVLMGCTDKKEKGEETTSTEAVEELSTQEEAAPKVNPEEGKALIAKLYSELYTNDKSINAVSKLLGDKLNAKLNEMDGEVPLVDYDPFINAQDYDTKSIQSTLTITELSDGLFQVDVEPMKDDKQTLQLTLGFDDTGTLKILDIPSNPDISVLK